VTQQSSHEMRYGLLSWLPVTRSQIGLLILLPLISVAAAIIAGAIIKPPFRAQAKLLVPSGHEHSYRPIIGDRVNLSPWKHEVAINAEREILNARSLKTAVVREMGAEKILATGAASEPHTSSELKERLKNLLRTLRLKKPRVSKFEKAVRYLNKELLISTVRDSNVIHLSFKHKKRDTAVLGLEIFLKNYLEQRSRLYAPSDLRTLESIMLRQRKLVDDAQQALMTYKAQHEIPDKVAIEILEEEVKTSRRRLQNIRDKIEDVQLERTLADARWTNVRVIEAPFAPKIPESLPPLVRIALAGGLGLLAAIVLIIIFNNFALRGWGNQIGRATLLPSAKA